MAVLQHCTAHSQVQEAGHYDSCWAVQRHRDSCGCHSYCYAWWDHHHSSADSHCQSLAVPAVVAVVVADAAVDLVSLAWNRALAVPPVQAYSNYPPLVVEDHCDDDSQAVLQVWVAALLEGRPIDLDATVGHLEVVAVVHSNHSVQVDSHSMHSFAAVAAVDNIVALEAVVPNSCNLVAVPTLVVAVVDADTAAFAVVEALGDGSRSGACLPLEAVVVAAAASYCHWQQDPVAFYPSFPGCKWTS